MKNKFIQFSALLFLFFTTQAHSNPITKINFIGLNAAPESSLIDLMPFKTGQNFSKNDSDKIIESLFQTGYFSNITVQKNNNELNISFQENPYIKYFDIKLKNLNTWKNFLNPQNQLIEVERIEDYAQDLSLNAGNIYTNTKLDELISTLKNEYISSGYYNIQITKESEVDLENRIGIELFIDQGIKTKINSMQISGSNNFTEKELLKLFKIGEADNMLINAFTKKDEYNKLKFDQGIQALSNFYLNLGYLDFKIINVTSGLNNNNENMEIGIQVSDGIQYKLGKVSIGGELGVHSSESLYALINLKKDDIFNRQLIIDDIQIIKDLYSDAGYAFVDVNPITKDFLDTVDIEMNISLNKKVYINRITISGNTRTQDEVVRREIGISEGGLYSRTILNKSVNNLRRLGYFSDVQMNVIEIPGVPDKLNLDFVLEETKTGSLSFSVSSSNNYGVTIGTGIQEKNIFGTGNTLNAELAFSKAYTRANFYFENPYFNEDNHNISYGAFLSKLTDDDIMKDSYEISTKGLSLGYGIPLTENTRINSKFEYSKNDISCGVTFSTSDYESSQCSTLGKDEFKLRVDWNENTLNDYMYPTDGSSNSIGLDIALPLGDYKYFKINANHSSYSAINKDITLKLTGDLGIASGYGNGELPFYKRYFGGGSGSVRGFGNKTLGPLYLNNTAKGGELSILGSANLITPAYFFNEGKNMRISAFIDAGNIYDKSSNIKLDELRMSTGIGFAYLSPIGPIGMYWSTPLLKKTDDTIENFSFSMGTGF
jgi:outer membrane protein insertion porin family